MVKKLITVELASGLEARPVAICAGSQSVRKRDLPGSRGKACECQEHHGNDDSWADHPANHLEVFRTGSTRKRR